MRKTTYIKKMKHHEEMFDKLWARIVRDTNQFVKDNPDIGMYTMQSTPIEKFIDQLALSGAWIHDRIEKLSGVSGNSKYAKSLTKKIRKALGYTL